MNEIYLISKDGCRDSINIDYYATNDEEIKEICLKDFTKYLNPFIVSINIEDLINTKKVTIEYYCEWDINKTSLEIETYYTFKLDRYVCN